MSNLAGRHIDFVLAGYREHQISVSSAGLFQYAWMRGSPVQGTNIESILKSVEFFIVDIDQSHIVVFAGENLRHGGANLSCAQNDYFHG